MESVVLVIHLILALMIIGLVLLQRSEGGGLGIGGGGGGLGGLATARGTANALTRVTAFCAAGFFVTSLTLGVMAGAHVKKDGGILDKVSIEDVVLPEKAQDESGIQYIPPGEASDSQMPESKPEDSGITEPLAPVAE